MSSHTSDSMVVKLENLNRLLEVAGDVIINASNLEHTYKSLYSQYEDNGKLNEELVQATREVSEAASRNGEHLHNLVQAIRTVGLKDLSFRARRTIREAARKTGKRVRLEVEGEELNLDKTIVEALFDPLVHQLTNAVTHGIEDSLERTRLGKPEEGLITLKASKNETDTFIEVSDDGAGLNMKALTDIAIKQGMLQKGAELTTEDALKMICKPGITTAPVLSEISGRGVGMDVVRERIEALGGNITMETWPGKGTTFTYRIPLISAVNILDALVVRAGIHYYAFPIINIIASISVPPDRVRTSMSTNEMVPYLDHLLPLYDLNHVLDTNIECIQKGTEDLRVLIIEHKGERLALKVSTFLEPQKLVIIPFGSGLFVRGLSGTTVLGSRNLGFIIDIPSFIRRAQSKNEPKEHASNLKQASAPPLKKGIAEPKEIKLKQRDEDSVRESKDISLTRSQYVLEAETILAQLNETLFALEQASQEEDEDLEELVNKAFRFFHTIKGNFAMMQLPLTAETIHAVESVLNQVRDRHMAFSEEIMDIMMDGVSFAEDVITQLKSGTWEDRISKNIIQGSDRILPKKTLGKIRNVDEEELEPSREGAYRLGAYARRSVPIYRCQITFDKGPEPPFLRGCLIYKRMCQVGDVLAVLPPLEEVERGLLADKIKFLFASEVNSNRLETEFQELLRTHYGVKEFQLSREQ